jgi:REP element-mobilizing transposase RayT
MRAPRIEVIDGVYHVTQHATGEEVLFRDVIDRHVFEHLLGTSVRRHSWRLHAYCQLDNHYHLVVQIREATLATGMRFLNSRYVQGFNERHGRRGTLVRGRYYAGLLGTEAHYLSCLAYLAMNPVGAGLCRRPEEWEWSSYGGGGALAPRPDALLRGFVDVALS